MSIVTNLKLSVNHHEVFQSLFDTVQNFFNKLNNTQKYNTLEKLSKHSASLRSILLVLIFMLKMFIVYFVVTYLLNF